MAINSTTINKRNNHISS